MPKLTATDPVINRATVGVTLTHGKHERTEAYFRLSVTIRGERNDVYVTSDSYRFSSGEWSKWRTVLQGYGKYTTPQYEAIATACYPLCEAWLGSEEFDESTKTGWRNAIRGELREERYSVARPTETLRRYGDNLRPDDLERLTEALGHLDRFLTLTTA